jgi:pyruvate,water dikinase
MMNLGNPEQAFQLHHLPNKGVGLAREEFIINSFIKVHPLALLNFHKITNKKVKQEIENITHGYEDKGKFFTDKLAYGVATIAAAFYPHDVVVRLSDFKSNEYANLVGGVDFEPHEDNPMIGWRGASRYYDERYKAAFALECKALKKVREEMGLSNVVIMVPFCRTVEEGKKVISVMAENGLKQGENGLRVYAMCEIPANVILADKFLDVFDGFSIGSNDLTQLTLGLDRDSELVAHIYDERDEAVKFLIKSVIDTAKRRNKHMGFCGDAPSSLPGFAEFLVDCGIESLSVTPDAVIKTILNVIETEKKLGILPP